jgi:hypothetical protein
MTGRSRALGRLSAGLSAWVSLTALGAGCAHESETTESAPEGMNETFADVPVPPADGPKLYVLRHGERVADKPTEGAQIIGWLRAGAAVARSEAALSHSGCDGGWYAVRPRGFVCHGEGTSLTGGPTTLTEPATTIALPYRYATVSGATPIYGRLPTVEEQHEAEPDLKKHFARRGRQETSAIGHASTDVPLDKNGMPSGPPVLLADSIGVDGDGNRTTVSYLDFGPDLAPPPTALSVLTGDAKIGALKKGSTFAVVGTVLMAEGPSGQRRFALTPAGTLVPLDRLEPAPGTTYHGIDLREEGLPLAFVNKFESEAWSLVEKADPEPLEDELVRRTPIPLTGRFRTVQGVRYDETKQSHWLRARDIIRVEKRHKLPDFVTAQQKWIDVSIAMQYAVLYEGRKPVYAMLISSGRDVLEDPETTSSTPLGTFRVRAKHVTRDLDSLEVERSFDVSDAPWVVELDSGNAFVGSVWGDRIGQATTHKDIALTPIDAHVLYRWVDLETPEGWRGVAGGEAEGPIVNVRR